MQDLAKVKWMGRLLQKGAIEESLTRYFDMLDEAEKSFQVRSMRALFIDYDSISSVRYLVWSKSITLLVCSNNANLHYIPIENFSHVKRTRNHRKQNLLRCTKWLLR